MKKSTPFFVATSLILTLDKAFAQSGDWAKEGVSIIGDLELGVGTIAVSILGVAVLLYGLWAVFTQRLDWEKGRTLIIGGAIFSVGPAMLKALLG